MHINGTQFIMLTFNLFSMHGLTFSSNVEPPVNFLLQVKSDISGFLPFSAKCCITAQFSPNTLSDLPVFEVCCYRCTINEGDLALNNMEDNCSDLFHRE